MVEGCGASALGQEAFPEFVVGGKLRRQELQRDEAAQDAVPREVYLAHAATTQQPVDLVARKERSLSQRHRLQYC